MSSSMNSIRNQLDFEEDTDQPDHAKNARLLENYKAIKAGQLKDKESHTKKSSPQLSPSTQNLLSASPNKTLTVTGGVDSVNESKPNEPEAPKIMVSEQQAQDSLAYSQHELFNSHLNDSGNSDESDDEENSDHEEDDDEDDDDEDDDDENEYENYVNQNEFRYSNDDTTDSASRTTDVTLLNNTTNNSSLDENIQDESPLSVKKIKKPKPDSKEKVKKAEKKAKKASSTSLNGKMNESKSTSLNSTDENHKSKSKSVKIADKVDHKPKTVPSNLNKSGKALLSISNANLKIKGDL